MSFVTVPNFNHPLPPNGINSVPTLAGSSPADINGSGQWVAYVGEMPITATIDRLFFRIGSATTGCGALARIETVDTATGLPTGTLVHANASQSVTITSGGADYTVTFPGTFSIVKGTRFAIVVAHNSGSPVAIRFSEFSDDNSGCGFPYMLDYDVSAGFRNQIALNWGLGVSGGSAVRLPFMWPINAVSNETFRASSTPDTIGNRFTLAAPMRICGVWAWLDLDDTATIHLYAADGATALASVNLTASLPPTTTAVLNYHLFASSVELAAGTYYLAVEATGSANIGLATCTFPDASWRAGSPLGGADFVYATCTQAPTGTGDWTVTDTKQCFLGLIIDGIDDGAGGGGGGGETSHVFAS